MCQQKETQMPRTDAGWNLWKNQSHFKRINWKKQDVFLFYTWVAWCRWQETRPACSGFTHRLRCNRFEGCSDHWGACPSCPLVRHTLHLTLWHWCSSAMSSATWNGSRTQRHCLVGPCRRDVLYVIAPKQSRQSRSHLKAERADISEHHVPTRTTFEGQDTIFATHVTEWQTYSSISESKSMKRSLGKNLTLLFAKDLETAMNEWRKEQLLWIS